MAKRCRLDIYYPNAKQQMLSGGSFVGYGRFALSYQ
jgi:hypothetical protein